jgi:Domain of unknown function (DUF4234)
MTATEVPIQGGPSTARVRDPIGVALLDLVTLGIYGFVWYYRVHCELADMGRARGTSELGDSPRTSLLAVMPGFLLVVPLVVSFWNASRRVEAAERLTGGPESRRMNPVLAFILMLIVFPAGAAYVQAKLNRVWAAQGIVADAVVREEPSTLVGSP